MSDPLVEIQERAEEAVKQVTTLAAYEPLSAAVHGLTVSTAILATVMGEMASVLTRDEREITHEALYAVGSILSAIPDVTREQSKLQ